MSEGDVARPGRGPAPASSPSRWGGGRRWRDLVVVAVVVTLVAVTMVVLGSGAGDEDSGTAGPRGARPAPPAPGTTTTTTIVLGPLLPELTGAEVLLVSGQGTRLVEVDTGRVAPVPREAVGVQVWQLASAGEWLISLAQERAVARRRPFDGGPVDLGPADQVFPTDRPGLVWLATTDGDRARIRQVRVEDRQVLSEVRLPAGFEPVGAVGEGVVAAGGGSTFVVRPDGAARRLPEGQVVAARGGRVATVTCGEDLRCHLAIVDLGDGTIRTVLPDPVPPWVQVQIAPDGTAIAVGTFAERADRGRLVVVDLAQDQRHTVEDVNLQVQPAWSPGSDWLFLPIENGMTAVRRADGQATDLYLSEIGPVNTLLML